MYFDIFVTAIVFVKVVDCICAAGNHVVVQFLLLANSM